MNTGYHRSSPSSLDLQPGEPAHPPLRLLERRRPATMAPSRPPAPAAWGWLSRLQRVLRPHAR